MIRKRLIFLFILQIALVLILSGIYLRYSLQNTLEAELGEKLENIAAIVAVQMDPSLVTLLGPGDEETRIYNNLRQTLLGIRTAAKMKRIVVLTPAGGIWLDTEFNTMIGTVYLQGQFNRNEIESVLQGRKASSILFRGNDGRLYKSGYAPLKKGRQVVGIVAVEGGVESLAIVNTMQRRLVQIGIVSLLFSVVLAVFTSHRLTAPLHKLRQSAQKIARGKLDKEIAIKGKDEIAFLAQTMEEMRKAILQRDERQKAMLAGVAHEIRNPLGGIELFAGLLHDELTNPEQKSNAEKILKESKNLKTLVQNFLDFAKPIVARKESCSVRKVWDETEQLLRNEFEKKNIAPDVSGDAMVFVDPQHLKQIFMNLAINALQAISGNGRISVTVSENKKNTVITFSDSGSGISPDIQKNIFEPFFSNKEKGLGLGLAMCKMMVEQNNGTIQLVESNNQGTTLQIQLPLNKS
ncbi:MAG: HAMP domain-containing protein [Actinobacteria bacterium]|nr:HAMP domain-containing protein [Actinomycetota bacterium]